MKFREKDNDNALPWDEIAKTDYTKWQGKYDINALKEKSEKRITTSVNFNLIDKNAQWLSKQNDKIYHLNFTKYKAEQKALKATVKQNDSLAKLTTDIPFEGLKADDAKYNNVDKDKGERYKTWIKNLRKDVYVNEASNIIKDMIAGSVGLANH